MGFERPLRRAKIVFLHFVYGIRSGWDQARVDSGDTAAVPPCGRHQGSWWASGSSCEGVIVFLHLVDLLPHGLRWVTMACREACHGLW